MLAVIGVNHHSAKLELRDKMAFDSGQLLTDLPIYQQQLNDNGLEVNGLVIVSTCNRSEVYMDVGGLDEEQKKEQGEAKIVAWLTHLKSVDINTFRQHYYIHWEQQALGHLMAVSSGINSMVVGETQIAGQIKFAYGLSHQANCLSNDMDRAFQYVFAVSKRIRSETAISENPVSVASVAVNLANRIFNDLSDKTALLIGAGDTIALLATHLRSQGIGKIMIANRTLERADALARDFNAEPLLLADIPNYLHRADIVASSTASQLPILGKGAVERALKLRKHRSMFIIDIAVPRDVEAEVNELDDVYLYSIDDLQGVIDESLRGRQDSADKGRLLIETAITDWELKLQSLETVNSVRQYRQIAHQIRDDELKKAQQLLQNATDVDKVMARFASNLTNKLIHAPTAGLKQASLQGDEQILLWSEQLLGLKPLPGNDLNKEKNNL